MILAINTLSTQVSQIYRIPNPTTTLTFNNVSGASNQGDSSGGVETSGGIAPISIAPSDNTLGVKFNSAVKKSSKSLDLATVKAKYPEATDFRIVSIGASPISWRKPGKTSNSPATGLNINCEIYDNGKSWSWICDLKGPTGEKYNPGVNGPKTTDTGDSAYIKFTFRADIEIIK